MLAMKTPTAVVNTVFRNSQPLVVLIERHETAKHKRDSNSTPIVYLDERRTTNQSLTVWKRSEGRDI